MVGPIAVLYAALATGHHQLPSARGQASSQEYVYASLSTGTQTTTARFPIVDGIVSSTPVSSLSASPDWGSAVGADGTLYLTGLSILSRHQYQPYVDVYAPGATGSDPPEREIVRVPLRLPGFQQIAVDQQGYLYYPTYKEGNRGYPVIDVFAPDASGRAKYVLRIKGDGGKSSGYMTLDGAGNLYVVTLYGIDEWANPHSAPVKVKHYCLKDDLYFGGIAADAAGDLFAVIGAVHGNRSQAIIEFRAGENPCPRELRTFKTNPPFFESGGMAEYGGNLYLLVGGGTGLYEIPETGGISRTPIATVPAAGGISVGIGP